jgi:hypothetical protein
MAVIGRMDERTLVRRRRPAERDGALTVLALARDLLADETRWVKGRYAVDRRGYSTDPRGRRARRWCAVGALHRAGSGADPAAEREAEALLRAACGARTAVVGVEQFNDRPGTRHADVLAAFDRAIDLGRGK